MSRQREGEGDKARMCLEKMTREDNMYFFLSARMRNHIWNNKHGFTHAA